MEARLKKVPCAVVPVVERLRMDAVQAVEHTRNRLHGALDDGVVVVRHQAVRDDLEPSFAREPAEERVEEAVVVDVAEDQAPVDPARRDVEATVSWKRAAGLTRHRS